LIGVPDFGNVALSIVVVPVPGVVVVPSVSFQEVGCGFDSFKGADLNFLECCVLVHNSIIKISSAP
jgi:hypothetical protein